MCRTRLEISLGKFMTFLAHYFHIVQRLSPMLIDKKFLGTDWHMIDHKINSYFDASLA